MSKVLVKGRYLRGSQMHGAGMPTDDAMAWRNLRDDRQRDTQRNYQPEHSYEDGDAGIWRERFGAGEGPKRRTAMSTYNRIGMGGDASDEANFNSPEEWMDSLAEGRGFGEDEDDEGPSPENPEDTPPMRSGPSHLDDTKFPFGMDPDMLRELEGDEEVRESMEESEKHRGMAKVLGRTANERAKRLHEMGGSPFGLPHRGRSLPKDWNWKSPQPMAKAWTTLKDSAKNWQFCESCKRGYTGEGCQYCIQKGTPYFPRGPGSKRGRGTKSDGSRWREGSADRIHTGKCEHCGGAHETRWHDIGKQPDHLKGVHGQGEGWPTKFTSRVTRYEPSGEPVFSYGNHPRNPSTADLRRRTKGLSQSSEGAWTRMQDPTTRSILQRFAHRGAENRAISKLPYSQRKGARVHQPMRGVISGGTYARGSPAQDKGGFPIDSATELVPEGKVQQRLTQRPIDYPDSGHAWGYPDGPSSADKLADKYLLTPRRDSKPYTSSRDYLQNDALENMYGKQARGQTPYHPWYGGEQFSGYTGNYPPEY